MQPLQSRLHNGRPLNNSWNRRAIIHGPAVTSDAGSPTYRELDDVLRSAGASRHHRSPELHRRTRLPTTIPLNRNADVDQSVNLISWPYTRARRVRRQAEPHRPRLRRAERPARAAWAAQRLLVDVAISV